MWSHTSPIEQRRCKQELTELKDIKDIKDQKIKDIKRIEYEQIVLEDAVK